MNVGSLIRQARRDARLPQSELARRLGVSQPVIARLESPDNNPELRTLERVADALGYRVEVSFRPVAGEVDETQIRRNLRLTPAERLEAAAAAYRNVAGLLPVRR